MSFNIGENVGSYRIIEQLGQGGMATVYKAYHASLDRYVALKVLHPAFRKDQTFTTRFQREARVIARLEHPNIVPIYDYSEHEAQPYLVMKYIEGDTLKARLNKGPLTSKEIEDVVNSIGSALAYAHKQGILHRDVKPSNVMIAVDGVMYLADFGLARIAETGESTMSSDSIMGTPQYISPEQAIGKKDLDAGTDIYSFGVMLYEMVVGQVPFSADTPFSIIHDHIYTPLPLPMKINPKVPEPVQRVLLKALAKDRIDRYATTEDLVTAFKEAWTESGIPMQGTTITMRKPNLTADITQPKGQSAAPAGGEETAKSPARKRSLWMWIGVGVVTLLCFGVAFFAIRNIPAVNPENPATATPTLIAQPTVLSPSPNSLPTLPTPVNGGIGGGFPPPNSQTDSPEVIAAKELVEKNPNDPNAHLQLSLAFWDSNQVRPAMDELTKALDLAKPGDKDFLLKAAEEFKAREAWVAAAGVYLRLTTIYKGADMPEEIENGYHESVYKSADKKELSLFVVMERVENTSPSLGHIARGRHALYNGDLKEAKTQLENAEKLEPNMYEARLLKAEIVMEEGNSAEAKDILLSISTDLNAPEWIRLMAENFLKTKH